MRKEFIPYNLALELKELGFDEPCFAKYTSNRLLLSINWSNVWCENINESEIYAPLYQQVFRWFREKYKLNGEVNHLPNVEKYGIITSNMADIKPKDLSKNENFERGKKVTNDFVKYETYEEAELVCLEKLIEIVKNK
jgi:hypothetical protein